MNLNGEIDSLIKELSKLKDSGAVDHVAVNYGVDRHGLSIEVNMLRRGVEKKVACMFARDAENIVQKVINKVNIILR